MSSFKVGDTVIRKKDGREFIIDGFGCCPNCGIPTIYLKGLNELVNNMHTNLGCGYINYELSRAHWWTGLFEKPVSIAECIENRLKVSIPELIEIKEVQYG